MFSFCRVIIDVTSPSRHDITDNLSKSYLSYRFDDNPNSFEIIEGNLNSLSNFAHIDDHRSNASGVAVNDDEGNDEGDSNHARQCFPQPKIREGLGMLSPRRLILESDKPEKNTSSCEAKSALDNANPTQKYNIPRTTFISGSNGVTISSPNILKGRRSTVAKKPSTNVSAFPFINNHVSKVIEVRSSSRIIRGTLLDNSVVKSPIAPMLEFAELCDKRFAS